jgi:hypothetical protein
VCANGGITTVSQRARLAIAEPSDVVFIAAECLVLRGPVTIISFEGTLGWELYLSLKEQNCWFMTCQTISSDDMVDDPLDCATPERRLLYGARDFIRYRKLS